MRSKIAVLFLVTGSGASFVLAGSPLPRIPPPNLATFVSPASTDVLAGALRGYLVKNVPGVLYEGSRGWGHTKPVARGVKWSGGALIPHPHLQYADKNDGDWRKIRVAAPKLADTLILDIRNFQSPETGKLAFDVFLAFDAAVEYEHQKWDAGIRLLSDSARARLRAKAMINCEVTTRLEKGSGLLPDAVFHLKVTGAHLGYDNLVVEHVAGVGGEAAKLIGDAVRKGLDNWRPSLERDLLTKADAALVKAGDLKDVRVSLASLFDGKRLKK
ncbi:MAG: hypothetical protein ACJ8FY_22445 [Gemmataceae bacterium]